MCCSPHILYVDDDYDSREMLALLVSMENPDCRVSVCDSSEKMRLSIDAGSVDLSILDYAMPDISGVDLCRQIRQIDQQTPVLFYSALAHEKDRRTALAAGANGYLVKPKYAAQGQARAPAAGYPRELAGGDRRAAGRHRRSRRQHPVEPAVCRNFRRLFRRYPDGGREYVFPGQYSENIADAFAPGR